MTRAACKVDCSRPRLLPAGVIARGHGCRLQGWRPLRGRCQPAREATTGHNARRSYRPRGSDTRPPTGVAAHAAKGATRGQGGHWMRAEGES
ncbi:hypothetical protein GW17_00023733 [Ensete ventricosum]|nr:hypothetical protein GW17_00023733 [Ensete ventricosum]